MSEIPSIDIDAWFNIRDVIDKYFYEGDCPYCLEGVKHNECKRLPNDAKLTIGEFLDKVIKAINKSKSNPS